MEKLKILFNKITKFKSSFKEEFKDGLMFPITFDHGFNVKWSGFKRGFLKKKWQYIVYTYALILTIFFGYQQYVFHNSQAASYGFNQTDWSEGASTTAVALHDTDQENYKKYYSKDSNINTSISGQISLNSATQTITETDSTDFDAGSKTQDGLSFINTEGNEIKMWFCGSDIDYGGETYPTVKIGTQCWMAKNLNIGTRIAGTSNQTNNATIEKYCYSNNDSNCTTYGGLYQWDEMMQYSTTPGAQGICPNGWHIPTDAEQHTLDDYLATGSCNPSRSGDWDCDPAGTALKSGGSSGFNGLLAGYRSSDGSFSSLGTDGDFWSSSESGSSAWRRVLSSARSTVFRLAGGQAYGFSVRCLKD